MLPDKNSRNDLRGKNDPENTAAALKEAEKDINNDPDLSPPPDPGADLDEGELARLEGED